MYDLSLLIFFYHGFNFQEYNYNGFHHALTMLSVHVSDIAIITVKNDDYRCIIHIISKSESINALKKHCS